MHCPSILASFDACESGALALIARRLAGHLETWDISKHHLALWHVATTGWGVQNHGGATAPTAGSGLVRVPYTDEEKPPLVLSIDPHASVSLALERITSLG